MSRNCSRCWRVISAPPADLDVVQVPAAHLVVEQVAGQPGQAGGLVDGVRQPLGRRSAGPSAASRCRSVVSAGGVLRVTRSGRLRPVRRAPIRAASGSAGSARASFSAPMVSGWRTTWARASGAVRPSSAAQPSTCGQSRCPACTSSWAVHVGEHHRGDRGVAVHVPAGQPGHFPRMLLAGRQASGVPGAVAADAVVEDGQGHA